MPIQLVFRGNYYELSDFLFRLNNLVRKRDGKLDVDGRLYAVDSVDFSKGDGNTLAAQISTTAFIYGAGDSSATAQRRPRLRRRRRRPRPRRRRLPRRPEGRADGCSQAERHGGEGREAEEDRHRRGSAARRDHGHPGPEDAEAGERRQARRARPLRSSRPPRCRVQCPARRRPRRRCPRRRPRSRRARSSSRSRRFSSKDPFTAQVTDTPAGSTTKAAASTDARAQRPPHRTAGTSPSSFKVTPTKTAVRDCPRSW